jgi:hypothetical protein
MSVQQFLFWTLAFSGAIVAGWWLAVRPAASPRDLATPVSVLLMLLAVLLGILALTGQDIHAYTASVYYFTLGR